MVSDDKDKINQYIEIYKAQLKLLSDISNRQIISNRFYTLVLIGLLVVFSSIIQSGSDSLILKNYMTLNNEPESIENTETDENTETENIEDQLNSDKKFLFYTTAFIGFFGLSLSTVWYLDTKSYLRKIVKKQQVLSDLECDIGYEFSSREANIELYPNDKNKNYEDLSRHILLVPCIFYVAFMILSGVGFLLFSSTLFILFLLFPISFAALYILWYTNQ